MPKKVDSNHTRLVKYFRDNGASVIDTHALPNGFDCLVGYLEQCVAVEFKAEGGKLTESQAKLLTEFKGWYEIVRDERDAARLMRAIEARDEILCPMPKAEIDGNR